MPTLQALVGNLLNHDAELKVWACVPLPQQKIHQHQRRHTLYNHHRPRYHTGIMPPLPFTGRICGSLTVQNGPPPI